MLGRVFKLHPLFDVTIFDILQTAPNAFLVVIAEDNLEWNELIWERWTEFAWRYGRSNALQRIVFANYDYYVDALLRARVVLDTHPYGGKRIPCLC